MKTPLCDKTLTIQQKDVYGERNIRLNLEEGGQAKECHPQGHDQSVTPDTVQMETERYSPLVPLT